MRGYAKSELDPPWEEQPRDARSTPCARRVGASSRPALGALLALAPFALVGLQRIFRAAAVRRAPEHGSIPAASDPAFADLVEHLTRAAFRPGNEVEILCNGDETFPRLWADLERAERSIDLQFYYATSGRVADRTFGILADRARSGVRVRVLYDPVGCRGLDGSYLEALRRCGVQLYALRPFGLAALDRLNHRAHSRIGLLDGAVGYTGDFGFSDHWLGDGWTRGSWRSTNARFRGPALREHSAAFATLWAEATGELLTGEEISAEPVGAAGYRAALLHSNPGVGSTAAERVWALTIGAARERCYITSGYFAPTAAQVQLLASAAARGVEVCVLTATARHTDIPPAYWAGYSAYPALLEAGVRIYEYQPSMMHAKSWVVDGVWCSVGALNLDNRSVALNEEVALMIHDPGFGTRLEGLFRDDLARARRVDLEEVRHGGWLARAKAWSARRISRLL